MNVCCGITRLGLGAGLVMGLGGSHGEDPLQARNAVQVRGTAGRSRGTLGDGAGAFVSLVSHQRNRIIIPLPTKIHPPVSKTLSLCPRRGRQTRHSAPLIYTTGETQDYTSNVAAEANTPLATILDTLDPPSQLLRSPRSCQSKGG